MANTDNDASANQSGEFEFRRAELVGKIGDSLEQVLTQMNALNRTLESIIEIGNEFASVEALWSQFESVMGEGNNADDIMGAKDSHTKQEGSDDV